jgi:hypothetical protein
MKDRQLHVTLPCETYERLKLMVIMKGTSVKKIVIDLVTRWSGEMRTSPSSGMGTPPR